MTSDIVTEFQSCARPLLEVFSSVMLLDQDLRILYSSPTLATYMPELDRRPRFDEVFDLQRPRSMKNFEEGLRHSQSLFLMRAIEGDFAVRGQMLRYSVAGEECLVFCGAPWLSWMVANAPEISLRLQDFSPQDVQLDQLFYMSTEARMVADLEKLNSELQEAKEELELAQAAKNRFFAQMSHEMRTPLNGIVSALALMQDDGLSGKAGDLLELARKSSSNLMEVINYVLDVSKFEGEDSTLDEYDFDLPELVGSVSDIVRARALEKGLTLSVRCDPVLSRWYVGDVGRLRQALLNLVVNAIKFTERGSVMITAEPASAEGQSIRIEVQDTGLGVPKKDQLTIFEAFTSMADHSEPGTGLGLDIARRGIESMGGKIGLSSAPGVGSTFWFELPLKVVEPARVVSDGTTALQPVNGDGPRFKGRILLVDDNETNLMLGSMILERMGVTVSQADSGERAVQMVADNNFDLVFMDISMPGIDGYEATRRIRKQSDADTLPIIALTAYASSLEESQSKASGMNGYLTKPIDRERLIAVLASWLELATDAEQQVLQTGEEWEERSQVDMVVLEDLVRQIGLSNVDTVIMKFSDEADRRWSALESATDRDELAREAHTLGSTCRSFGLPSIADSLNQVESCAKTGESFEQHVIEQIGNDLSSGLLEIKSVLASLHSAAGESSV